MTDATPVSLSTACPWPARILARPMVVAVFTIGVLVVAGLAALVLGAEAERAARTGAPLFGAAVDEVGRALLDALCRSEGARLGGASGAALAFVMWSAMALLMMLPTASPMIMTYAQIAETAQAKGESVVSPAVLIAGYGAVWLGFAGVAATAQYALSAATAAGALALPSAGAGVLLVAAGLFQFSRLKEACLTKCQRPFPFFFRHWTTRPLGVLRLGVRQGLYCLGCCVAMMLLMFIAGFMNLAVMAVLGTVMAIEKLTQTSGFSRAVGSGLILAGGAVVLISLTS